MDHAHDTFLSRHPDWHKGWAMSTDDAPAFWNVGTYWRFLSTDATTNGRSTTFEEGGLSRWKQLSWPGGR